MMLKTVYEQFNQKYFSPEKYRKIIREITAKNGAPWRRMCETPIFISRSFADEIIHGAEEIIRQSMAPSLRKTLDEAVPPEFRVPSAPDHPAFFIIDFAVTAEGPRLIEMQGFSSGFGFFHSAAKIYKNIYGLGDDYKYLLAPKTDEEYATLLKKTILGAYSPENVILMEINPREQRLKADFAAIQNLVGMPIVDIAHIIKKDRQLFYLNARGQETLIRRIYSRVVTGEFQSLNMAEKISFNFSDDLDVEWAGDPGWFRRISKFTMPFLDHPMVPETKFLSQLPSLPPDLENYVLKPVFSNAGAGVKINISHADIEAVSTGERRNFILMRKVNYSPFIPDLNGNMLNTEIRIMFVWPDRLVPILMSARVMRANNVNEPLGDDDSWCGLAPVLIVDR